MAAKLEGERTQASAGEGRCTRHAGERELAKSRARGWDADLRSARERSEMPSSKGALTMQQGELVDLALDCGLPTDALPMARVQGVFARADQTDEGKGGDHALELHEFLEAVVQLAFGRANPRFGSVGKEREAPNPLPDCLDSMLRKCLMKKAKQDGLAKVKKVVWVAVSCSALI